MKIITKLTLGFLAGAFLVLVVGYFSASRSQRILETTIGENSAVSAQETLRGIDRAINRRVEELRYHSQYLVYVHKEKLIRPERASKKKGKDAPEEKIMPFAQELIDNKLAEEIKKELESEEFYQKKYKYNVYSEIVITNKYGVNIAQTQKVPDYYQADKKWWQSSKEEGLYVEGIKYDKTSRVHSIIVAVRIDGVDGSFLGVMKAVLNIQEAIDTMKEARNASKYKTTNFKLLTGEGKLIYETKPGYEVFKKVEDLSLFEKQGKCAGYLVVREPSRGEKLLTHAHSHGYRDYKGLGWVLMIEYEMKEIFAPVAGLKNILLRISLTAAILAVLLGLFISRSISDPITKLKSATIEIGKGNLDAEIKINSKDEIGDLAGSFKKMVSDIKEKQSDLEKSKTEMESMVESMAEGVIMTDEQGEIVVLNPRARRMLNFDSAEEITTGGLDAKLKTLKLDKPIRDCRKEKHLVVKEVVASGEEVQILRCDITPVKGKKEEIIGIVTILRDITKEKEIDRMKTEFVSTVSHELRTPLTTMKEFASIISDEIPGKLTEDQKEYVDIIKGNIDRLSRLINDLLDISKIEAGKMELKKMLIDVTNLVNGVVSMLKPRAVEKHIKLKTSFQTPLSKVHVAPDKMVQIFTNLVGNAIKFTPENGEITVEMKDTEKEMECSVSDTGVGIAAENLNRVFGKFQQFDRVAGPGAKGTGLGLAITKELVQMHNGRIWIESKPGQGSKFIFTLPKYTAESFFKEYVDNRIRYAMKKNFRMSLLFVSIAEIEKLKDRLSDEKIQVILKDIEGALKNSLHQEKGSAIFRDTDDIAVILGECDKESVLRIKGMLEDALVGGYLAQKKLTDKVKLNFSYATCPDDAQDAEGLVKKAKMV